MLICHFPALQAEFRVCLRFSDLQSLQIWLASQAAKAIQPGVEREFYVAEKYYKQKKKRPAVVLSLKEFEVSRLR